MALIPYFSFMYLEKNLPEIQNWEKKIDAFLLENWSKVVEKESVSEIVYPFLKKMKFPKSDVRRVITGLYIGVGWNQVSWSRRGTLTLRSINLDTQKVQCPMCGAASEHHKKEESIL